MFPRQPPPVQWAPRDYAAHTAEALRQRGAPALASAQGNQWIAPRRPPFPPQQQFRGSPQVPPRPMGYPVAHASPGAPQGRYDASLVSAGGGSDVQFLGYKRPWPAGTSMQPVTGYKAPEETREFTDVMQQHRHNMQAPHHSQVDQATFQSRNSGYFHEMRRKFLQYQSRMNSAVPSQLSPGLPCNQSNTNAQYDLNQARASSASPESASIEVNYADSRLSFKIPVLRRDHRAAYSSSRALRNPASNIESPSCVDSITSSQTIKTSPVTSPDPLCNMQNWSAPNAASVHPTCLDSNPYQQPPGSTQLTHGNNAPVTHVGPPRDTNAHFQNQAVGDPTVSSTIKSPVSLEPEEPPTINEKTAITENAVDARKPNDPVPSDPVPSDPVPNDPVPSDPAPKANVFKPPRRMFSRKGKCLSGLFRKTPQGFPHVSFDFEVNCFLCNRMAAGNSVYEHMFFGNLKCIECGHVVRSCEDFKIVRHNSVECGVSKRKHRLASWADCPVEFLVYSLEQSLASNRAEDCTPPSTSDVTNELENYTKKLSLLRFYKPWKSAFRRCSEYVKSMNKPEDAQEAINREDTEEETNKEEGTSGMLRDTKEEINNEEVNSVTPGTTQEEINKEEVNNFTLGATQEEIHMEEDTSVTLGTTQEEINKEEVNNFTLGATQEETHMEEDTSVTLGTTQEEVNNSTLGTTQEETHMEEDTSVTLGTTQEEVNNSTLGATEEEAHMEEANSVSLGTTQEETHMEDVFPRETQEVNSEVNNDIRQDSHEEMRGQETRRDTGGSTFYDLVSSQSERQEEPQVEGISINEALEQYQEHSQLPTDDAVSRGVKEVSRERTLNLQMFESDLYSEKDAYDNEASEVSNIEGVDNAGAYTQEPGADTPEQRTSWDPNSDDTFASMVEEPEMCDFSTRISENEAYERSFGLSKRLSTSSPEPEENQVVYYYPSEKAPEECPMCYYTLCATMFTLNTTNFRLSTECPDCSLNICIVYKDSVKRSKKPKRVKHCL